MKGNQIDSKVLATAAITTTSWMLPGELCWIETDTKSQDASPFVFQPGIICEQHGNSHLASVVFSSSPSGPVMKVNANLIHERNKESLDQGWEDMVSMNILNDAEILNNVHRRFAKDLIFSYIGPTLIVMNPYKMIAQSFNPDVLILFQKSVKSNKDMAFFPQSSYPPHVYALSANAYVQLFANNKNQAIVISGESGAGKTENAKFSMQYLTSLSGHKGDNLEASIPIEEKILRCNPILEAFGNAKTVRNNNSSRFGKYVRILIEKNRNRRIKGACIQNYLLEKSRVTIVAEGERNYHIFYAILAGLTESSLQNLYLTKNPKNYFYLSQSSSMQVEGIDDIENFKDVLHSFERLNFSRPEITSIEQYLAAILHLGNITFDESSFSDKTPCKIENPQTLHFISEVLQVEIEELQSSLVNKRRVIAGSKILSPISKQECMINRDSMARALYDKMFIWLVYKLNQNIMPTSKNSDNECLSLGLLDIFGFENFQVNSFEQLCINFTNEKLQQLYITYVFKSEEEEFKSEGLNDYMKQVNFKDNQAIIDLLAKPPFSIYDLLDESCMIATGTDEALLQKLTKQHTGNEFLISTKPHLKRDTFTVRHTAKDVEYTISGFRVKNKDEISDALNESMNQSRSQEIQLLWQGHESPGIPQKAANSKTNKFLGAKFRNQIQQLMQELCSCDVHFIRCIKPNEQKLKEVFDEKFVMQQIRYLGILESVRVRKEGFPSRYHYQIFYERYRELSAPKNRVSEQKFLTFPVSQKKELCLNLADESLKISNISNIKVKETMLVGSTKIYMKLSLSSLLDSALLALMKKKNAMASMITKNLRVFVYKKSVFKKIKLLKQKFDRFIILQRKFREYQKKKREQKLKHVKRGFEILKGTVELRVFQAFSIFKKAYQNNLFKVCSSIINSKMESYLFFAFNQILAAKSINVKEQQPEQKVIEQTQVIKQEQIQLQQQQTSTPLKNDKQEKLIKTSQEQDLHNVLQEEEIKRAEKYINIKNIKDEFKSQGLDIWPDVSSHEREKQLKLVKSNESDDLFLFTSSKNWNSPDATIQPQLLKQSQFEIDPVDSLPDDPDFTYTFADIHPNLIQRVRDQNFFTFCDSYIFRSVKNFGKKMPAIDVIMSYSKNNLIDPLTNNPEIRNHAQLIFRSMLKLAKNRRSRFTTVTHLENIILMCFGTPEKMQEVIYSSIREENTKIVQNYNSKVSQSHQSIFSTNTALGQTEQEEDDEPNIKEILATKIAGLIGNCHQPVRDECYMQICKQINGQPSGESLKILISLLTEITGLFSPSDFLLIPLMNFCLYIFSKSEDSFVQNESKYIFIRFAKLWQSYNMIKMVDFHDYTDKFIMDHQIFTDFNNDELIRELKEKKLTKFGFFYKHLQRVESREILPSPWEREAITKHRTFRIKIYLLNEQSISVDIKQYSSVKEVRDSVLQQLGMQYRSQYFGLVLSKFCDGKYFEVFLKNNQKMLDSINLTLSEKLYFDSAKKVVSTKFYLRIKICYQLYTFDTDSIIFYFMQCAFDVRQNRYPLKQHEAFILASFHLFAEFGPYNVQQESIYYRYAVTFLPLGIVQPKAINDLYSKVMIIYKQLDIESQQTARWKYLELLRTKDTFMTYQLESQIYSMRPSESGSSKSKEPDLIYLGIRPSQIVILNYQDKTTKEVIEMEQIATWGVNFTKRTKSNSHKAQQFFFIKVKTSDVLYVFNILYLHVAKLMIHSYQLTRNMVDEETDYSDCFLDILTILFDKEDQVPE